MADYAPWAQGPVSLLTDNNSGNPWTQNPLGPVGNWLGMGPEAAPPVIDMSGQPAPPAFTPNWDPSMSMLPGYEKEVDANSKGFNDYFNQATQQGPSAWANLAMNQQSAEAQNQKEQAQQSTAANTASADDNLAMQGGLSSGARERVQESGANNATNATQNIARQEGLNNMQIGINDSQNKMQELSQIPGMEANRVSGWQNVNAADTAAQVGENQSYNQYLQSLYAEQGQMWGAGKQAQATADSAPSKGGGKG